MLDVLPRALVAAAAEVRATGRGVEPVLAVDLGDAVLTDALRTFCAAWGAATDRWAEATAACADDLGGAAAEYVDVESLLMPRALR